MDADRTKQLAHLAAAEAQILAWTVARRVPLVRVEFVVPFVETDFGVSIWLFYGTDADIDRLECDGSTQLVREEFLRLLRADGYPADWLSGVVFVVDSQDNVVRHYEGSYFDRLR